MISRGDVGMQSVKHLCLDEADRMMDMGFAPQLKQIINESGMPKDRQTSMFSATFAPEIQRIAADFLNDYLFLAVGRIGSTSEHITQEIIQVNTINDKYNCLLGIVKRAHEIDPTQRVLVFSNTKRG